MSCINHHAITCFAAEKPKLMCKFNEEPNTHPCPCGKCQLEKTQYRVEWLVQLHLQELAKTLTWTTKYVVLHDCFLHLWFAHGAKTSKLVEYKQLAKWFLKTIILLATLWSKIFNLSNFDMICYFIDPPNEHVPK
jgi:hypothetical protein